MVSIVSESLFRSHLYRLLSIQSANVWLRWQSELKDLSVYPGVLGRSKRYDMYLTQTSISQLD